MLEKIEINNFQSHKNTKLILSEGINIIIGESDSGKTAILRALFWVIYNRPTGDSFISHWSFSEGKQVEPCSVFISKNNKVLQRIRESAFNGYIVDGQEYKALRAEVPNAVNEFFNLSDVNIQKQMDSPFLLSGSPGEIARFFNRIIKLDQIDRIISLTESKRRETKKEIETLTKKIEEDTNDILKLEDIESLKKLFDKAIETEEKIKDKKKSVGVLEGLFESYNDQSILIRKSRKLLGMEPLLIECETIKVDTQSKMQTLQSIKESLEMYNRYKLILDKDITKILVLQDSMIEISEKVDLKRTQINTLSSTIKTYKTGIEAIEWSDGEVQRCKDLYPDVCPVCGNSLKGEKE